MKRRRNRMKWLGWFVVLALLVTAAVVGYKVWEEYSKDDGVNSSEEEIKDSDSKSDAENGTDSNKLVNDSEDKKDEDDEEEEFPIVMQYEGENPNTSGGITGVVTYAGVSGDTLLIRVNIDQYLASGSCALALSQDGAVFYEETVGVVDSASTATCEGFNIPISKVKTSGTIGIVVLVKLGEKSGVIEGEVSL